MEVIYADSLFVINTVVNYLLLLASGHVCSLTLRRWRIGCGAALGGVYALLCFLPGLGFLISPLYKLAAALLMLLASYGGEARFLRTAVVFFAVSAAFGGAVFAVSMLGGYPHRGQGFVYVSISPRVLFFTFALSYTAISLVFRRSAERAARSLLQLSVSLESKTVSMTALRDTGNVLYEPVTGRKVIIADPERLLPLFSAPAREILRRSGGAASRFEALTRNPLCPERFLLIPYTAVGVKAGMLLAFRPDELMIDGAVQRDCLVALSPNKLGDEGDYYAIA